MLREAQVEAREKMKKKTDWNNIFSMVNMLAQSLPAVVAEQPDVYPTIETCVRMYEHGFAHTNGGTSTVHPVAVRLVQQFLATILDKYGALIAFMDYFVHNTRHPTVLKAIEALLTWMLDLQVELQEKMYEEHLIEMEAMWGSKSQLQQVCNDRLCTRYRLPIIPLKLSDGSVMATYTIPFRSIFYPLVRGDWMQESVSFAPLQVDVVKVPNTGNLGLLLPSGVESSMLIHNEMDPNLSMVAKLIGADNSHMDRIRTESIGNLVACGVSPRVAKEIIGSCTDMYLQHTSNQHKLEDFLCIHSGEKVETYTIELLLEKLGVDAGTNAYCVLSHEYSTCNSDLSPTCWFLQRAFSQLTVVGVGSKQTDVPAKPGEVSSLISKNGTTVPIIYWDPLKSLNEIELHNILSTVDPSKVPHYNPKATLLYHGTSLAHARNIATLTPGIDVNKGRPSLDFGINPSYYLGTNLQTTSDQTWKYRNGVRGIVVYAVPPIVELESLHFPGRDYGAYHSSANIRKDWRQLVCDSRNTNNSSLVQDADSKNWVFGLISTCKGGETHEEVRVLDGISFQLAVKESPLVQELNKRVLCVLVDPPMTRNEKGNAASSTHNQLEPHKTGFSFGDFEVTNPTTKQKSKSKKNRRNKKNK